MVVIMVVVVVVVIPTKSSFLMFTVKYDGVDGSSGR